MSENGKRTNMQELLIATHNKGKVAELSGLLAGLPVGLRYLSEFPEIEEVEETGVTFAENARLKAAEYARQSGLLAIADDSGLEIEALDNRPGVYSARYGGHGTGFDEKVALVLSELGETGDVERRARFVCAAAVADKNGEILFESESVCPGRIAKEPRGNGGFGYDPIFIPDGFDHTFGELSEAIKQKISHRAAAFREIIPFLRDFIAI